MIPPNGTVPEHVRAVMDKLLETIERPAPVLVRRGTIAAFDEVIDDGRVIRVDPPCKVWFVNAYRIDAENRGYRDRVALTDHAKALAVANRSWWIEAAHRFLENDYRRKLARLADDENRNDRDILDGGPVFGEEVLDGQG